MLPFETQRLPRTPAPSAGSGQDTGPAGAAQVRRPKRGTTPSRGRERAWSAAVAAGDLRAARAVRDRLAAEVSSWEVLTEATVCDVRLCAWELIVNALLHGAGGCTVTVVLTGARVRVTVHDADDALPRVRAADPDAPGGRGLPLVAELTAAWGVERGERGRGKAVWFECVGQVP